jgi:hypothetical protein
LIAEQSFEMMSSVNLVRGIPWPNVAFPKIERVSGGMLVKGGLHPAQGLQPHVVDREVIRENVPLAAAVTIRHGVSHLLTDIVLDQIV